jgi:hypothetical protein
MRQPDQEKRVLRDHKKVGQKLIPPFVAAMPTLQEVSYRKHILPEILWIEVISHQVGGKRGAAIALAVARAAVKFQPTMYAWLCSNYVSLSLADQEVMLAHLEERDEVSRLLSPLIAPYPVCPLAFLCRPEDRAADKVTAGLSIISAMLPDLLARMSPSATRMQAGATYIAFCTDKLTVQAGTSLAAFPEIERYPTTELSQKVAAGVRGFLNGTTPVNHQLTWPNYFWNQGRILSPCTGDE